MNNVIAMFRTPEEPTAFLDGSYDVAAQCPNWCIDHDTDDRAVRERCDPAPEQTHRGLVDEWSTAYAGKLSVLLEQFIDVREVDPPVIVIDTSEDLELLSTADACRLARALSRAATMTEPLSTTPDSPRAAGS
jgi:hypothetical protein